jgi:hypothetical protein
VFILLFENMNFMYSEHFFEKLDEFVLRLLDTCGYCKHDHSSFDVPGYPAVV